MALLLVPVVLVLVLFAPQILLPFNEDYAEHGTTVLRLLAAGALPRVVVELYIGVLRVQGRTGVLAALQGAMCTLVLGAAAVLFAPAGIAGAGWAVLLSMTLIAAVSAVGLRSALRRNDRLPAGRSAVAPAYGTRWARLNATAGYGTNWARRAAYEREGIDEDTVTLFIGRPGYEREALQADTLALIVRPHGGGGRDAVADEESVAHEEDAARSGAAVRSSSARARARGRWVGGVLWGLLGVGTAVFWAALRELPWSDGPSADVLTGRQLLAALPLTALVAGGSCSWCSSGR